MNRQKYYRKPMKVDGINTIGHEFVGMAWPVVGSTGNLYEVMMHNGGWSCTCWGFTGHGHCKHIREVTSRFFDEVDYAA